MAAGREHVALARQWQQSRLAVCPRARVARDKDISAYLPVPAAIQFQADHDWPSVRARCHELLRELRDVPFLRPVSPDSTDWYIQMAAFELPACDVMQGN